MHNLATEKNLNREIHENIVEIKNFTKKFKNFISVDNISFNIKKGSIHGFIGPNGSGKTTTIKSMIGAYIIDDGNILINGHKASSVEANKLIGYIPEKSVFPDHLTTYQYLVQMAQLSGLTKSQAVNIVKDKLIETNLWEHRDKKPKYFSSGMQKKVLLIQSLLIDAQLLIFDEPAANLDPLARNELFNKIIELKKQGKTVLISSHILTELEKIVDSVTFIYYGRLLFSGSVDELMNKYKGYLFIKTDDLERTKQVLEINGFKSIVIDNDQLIISNTLKTDEKIIVSLLIDNFISIKYINKIDLTFIYNQFINNKST